jgi:hypothetical protein
VGVIPNFYSSYNWNAPPMLAKQKFPLSIRSMIDPVSFLSVTGIAGASNTRMSSQLMVAGSKDMGSDTGTNMSEH